MAGDEELLVDDKDVFAAALSDTPPAEPEQPSEEPKPEGDRPRDEQGRFLPKAADAETQQPAAEPQAEQPSQATAAADKPPAEDAIPSWRLREVSQARREEAQARQAAEERSRVLEAQLQHLMQQQARQQQPPELPDFIEQPQAFAQAIQEQARQEIERFRAEMEQREIHRSLQRADQTHGEEFREAYIAFNAPELRGDVRLLEQVRNAYDQGEAILAWHRQQKALREIGPDPKAYRQKLKAELLADPEFRREYGETLRSQATTRPSSVTSLPNLARAPGSSRSSGNDEWPTTDAEIFADAARRRA